MHWLTPIQDRPPGHVKKCPDIYTCLRPRRPRAPSLTAAPVSHYSPGMDATPPPPVVAIVGAGPSGLFAAQALVAGGVRVDIFDRLPTPFGLLRYGVAPDHTSIKAVATALARVFESPLVRFCGLVEFGKNVTRDDLLEAYDAVIYAAGASEDVPLRIPGEDLPGSRSAREFVAWYSGHPDASPAGLDGVRQAVAVGVGNVARMLLKDPTALAATDMPEAVLAALRATAITDVWVVGRRGPHHASFTTPELRELVTTPGVQVRVINGDFDAIDDADLDRRTRANVQVLREAAATTVANPRATLHLAFWHRPTEIQGGAAVEAVVLERTALQDGRVVGAGEPLVVEAQLVLRAIGYRAVPLPGVSFDPRAGVIPNDEGRVLDLEGARSPREYVVGWIKRGPIGVIGTNKSDAAQTVRHVLDDLASAGTTTPRPGIAALAARGLRPSTFEDWQRIDAAEIDRGARKQVSRTKIEAWSELLDLVQRGRPGGPPTPADERA